MNPMDVKRGVDKAVVALVEELKKRSKKITTQATRTPASVHERARRGEAGRGPGGCRWPRLPRKIFPTGCTGRT